MGIESRDWYRDNPPSGARSLRLWLVFVAIVIAGAALSPPVANRVGYTLPFGLNNLFRGQPGKTTIGLFPGTPTITIHTAALYPRDDPWQPWLADESTCPGGERISAPAASQVQTTLCLINYARARQGLQPVALLPLLNQSAAAKAADIAACHEFAHAACGKQPDQVARDIGYTGAFGENIYMSTGRYASPRVAIDRWLNSQGHRENLFRPEWRSTGIALLPNATAHWDKNNTTIRDGVVWVNEFGV